MVGVAGLVRRHAALWRRCDGRRGPRLRHFYTAREQAAREVHAGRFLRGVESALAHRASEAAILPALRTFARAALDWNEAQIGVFLDGGFPRLARGLAEQARRFDPGISAADIYQASRNVWTAGGLQILLGGAAELTPALFAYSMLYPYTDNHLDDPSASLAAKRAFNQTLRRRLCGQAVEPANDRERKACALVSYIESQYDRARYPALYRSLLAIQKAQEESLGLRREASLAPADLLRGVVAKGGTSVLADGYLAAGRLTAEQEEFAFGWGVLLQFGDDLQDVLEDLAGGTATLFSESAGRQPLDRLTNRVFEFGECVFARMRSFRAPGTGPVKQFIRNNAVTLLITAAGAAHRLHSSSYIQALERHSPFRFGFVREHREHFFGAAGLIGRLVAAVE